MDHDQLDQIIQAYVRNPRHRGELHDSQLTVFPGKLPRARVAGQGLLLATVALACVAWIYVAVMQRTFGWIVSIPLAVATLAYLVIGVFVIIEAARMTLTIDLTTGEAAAHSSKVSKPVANLADGLSFTVARLKRHTFAYTSWFPFHCMLTRMVNGEKRQTFLIGFATIGDYQAFTPVLDALLRRFSRATPSPLDPEASAR